MPHRVEETLDAMGATWALIVYHDNVTIAEAAAHAALIEIQRVEGLLSHHREESEWSLVNREASRGKVPVSDELFHLLCRCMELSRLSDGAFDITVGAAVKAWGFDGANSAVPARANFITGYRTVALDRNTVHFTQPGLLFDPGGIGKGYAVDCAVSVLRQYGISTALVAASRSTIYGLGAPPNEPRGWQAGIAHPLHPHRVLKEVFLRDMSLSTSGAGPRSIRSDSGIYSHVIDPRTCRPAGDELAAVIAPDALTGEAWTKACLLNGETWGTQHPLPGVQMWTWFPRDLRT